MSRRSVLRLRLEAAACLVAFYVHNGLVMCIVLKLLGKQQRTLCGISMLQHRCFVVFT